MTNELVNLKNRMESKMSEGKQLGKITRSVKGKEYDDLVEHTKFLDDIYQNVRVIDRVICLLEDIDSSDKLPTCKYCGWNKCLFSKEKDRYFQDVCSQDCGIRYGGTMNADPERAKKAAQKRKQTTREKYGKDHVSQLNEVKNKKHQTARKNYGSLKRAYHDTAKQTIRTKYGVDNASKLDWVKEKKIETSRKNWGTDYPWQSEMGKRQMTNSLFNKYGVTNISQLEEVKAKKIATSLKNWGEDNPSKHPEIRGRILKSSGKRYVTKSGKVILYDGFENIILDYLYESYDEELIIPQPNFGIRYFVEDKERVWFPDCLILTDPRKLIEFKTVFNIDQVEECLLAAKVLDYDTYIIFQKGNELTKIDLLEPGHWLVSSLTSGDNELRRIENWFKNKGINCDKIS